MTRTFFERALKTLCLSLFEAIDKTEKSLSPCSKPSSRRDNHGVNYLLASLLGACFYKEDLGPATSLVFGKQTPTASLHLEQQEADTLKVSI